MSSDNFRSRREYQAAEDELTRIEDYLDGFPADQSPDVFAYVAQARMFLEHVRGLLERGSEVVHTIRQQSDPHYANPTSESNPLDPAQPGLLVMLMCRLHEALQRLSEESIAPSSELEPYSHPHDWTPPSIQCNPPAFPNVLDRDQVISRLLVQARQNSTSNAEKGRVGADIRWSSHKDKTALRKRGLLRVLRENPHITATELISWLDGRPRTYDDEDLELSETDGQIVIEDLSTGKTTSFPKDQLSTYLLRARRR